MYRSRGMSACSILNQTCNVAHQEIIQERHSQQLFSVLIPALEDPESR
jgi:hypothetical protein